MKTSEILIKAKQLIVNPENWMQGDYTNGQGCFCGLGAIAQVSLVSDDGTVWFGEASNQPAGKLLRLAVDGPLTENGYSESTTFAAYNDNYGHTKVMEAFDKAIELAVVKESESQANKD